MEYGFYFDFERYGLDKHYIEHRVSSAFAPTYCRGGSIWHAQPTARQRGSYRNDGGASKIFWPGIEVNIYADKVVFMNFAKE